MSSHRMVLRLSLAAAFAVALPALGDNCGSEDDCKAVPTNVDTATGIAGAGAGGAILWGVANGGRRKPPKTTMTFDPGADLLGDAGEAPEAPPEEGPVEGSGSSGSAEDLFGTGSPGEGGEAPPGGGPPDLPLGEDPASPGGVTPPGEGRPRPPILDMPLGEDAPTPPPPAPGSDDPGLPLPDDRPPGR